MGLELFGSNQSTNKIQIFMKADKTVLVKKLPASFTVNTGYRAGSKFTKMEESKAGYVYIVEYDGQTWYEIFRVFHKKVTRSVSDILNGTPKKYEEIYPKQYDFGKWAWRRNDFGEAVQKLKSLK